VVILMISNYQYIQ